ncbi:FecR family protein [Rufibacter quisquiliarum]|uniref:Ferric-dicitrate binding protein FerR (Iron transport regulator) n=1 Tax=Rufibacter quisquiliarum TaxID=1549639 RepID=A0A839GKZ2_9BACT|nr:FecR domain-containing protein [Rufibacter quisquiliarum]MBA9076255.1 ferric-dicitrate binding protein FerR (iron transport regulator) [Rufibacter quisquiliarum]
MNSKKGNKRYQDLAEKWLNGTITPEEEQEFSTWYHTDQDAPVTVTSYYAESEAEHKAKIFHAIKESINQEKESRSSRKKTFLATWISAAAVIALLLVSVGAYFSLLQEGGSSIKAVTKPHLRYKNDVPAGGEKALLTLADGQVIVLEESRDGMELEQGIAKVIKMNGSLAYNQGVKGNNNEVVYNTVSTPRGGQYQVVLADGSKVWLNAASSIRFPTAFTGKERKVQLIGEAYFEIARNTAMPFKVEAGEVEVKVLGTHFNVMAYQDEKVLETTLLEGSVQVTQAEKEQVLVPGQQAVHQYGGAGFKLKKVDVEDVTAWKNGVFLFEQSDLKQVMRQVQRWYDVEVVYEGTVPALAFTGVIPRKENVSKLLEVLEMTGGVEFEISGRTVLVHKKGN